MTLPELHPFPAAVRETIRRERLVPAPAAAAAPAVVLAAVSGGPDSMALLRVLLDLREELGIEVIAAHWDHAVRAASAEDAGFVRDWAERWGVELVEGRRDGAEGAVSEADLRDARYAFLLGIAAERGAIVAVGHHADDRLETFLAQLIRGAGPRGLSLPRPCREDGVIRPLFDCSRNEILDWLRAQDIPWRSDPSNEDGSNLRSRLRHEVVPLLHRENPEVATAVGRTATLMAAVDDYLAQEAATALDSLLLVDGPEELVLDGPSGRAYHPLVLSTLVREAARRLGFDPATVGFDPLDRLVRAWKEGGRCALEPLGGLRVEVDSSTVVVTRSDRPEAGLPERELPVPGELVWPGGHPESAAAETHLTVTVVEPPADPRAVSGPATAWLDAARVQGSLRVRTRRPGDRYRPLGAPGSVKVQDLFVDRKVARIWRDRVPLIVDSEGILWIPGFRLDERVRVTDRTRTALCLEVAPRPPVLRAESPERRRGETPVEE